MDMNFFGIPSKIENSITSKPIFGLFMHSVTQLNGNIFLSPQQIWLKISGNACLAIKVSRVLVLKMGNFGGKISL
jgi:hypothetical protein